MKRKTAWMVIVVVAAAFGWFALPAVHAPAAPQETRPSSGQTPPTASGVLESETNLVLVDVIAQDKKGNYIQDLDAKEFRVYEDDQEQVVSSFSHGTKTASGENQKNFLVLFFDNSTMTAPDQVRARESAQKFVETAGSENRLTAVADFGGMFKLTQNFTADTEVLKRAVQGVKFGQLQANAPGQTREIAQMGRPSLIDTTANYAARSVLLAIRNLSKSLRQIQGRKTLVFFSAGFPLNVERQSELTATIDAANKANVAIYPIDVRGLSETSMPDSPGIDDPMHMRQNSPAFPPGAQLRDGLFPHVSPLLAASQFSGIKLSQVVEQGTTGGGGNAGGGRNTGGGNTGGGNTGGGNTGGGNTGGGRGGFGGGSGQPGGGQPGGNAGSNSRGGFGGINDPFSRSVYDNVRRPGITPPMIESASANQQVLYALATGTGGFTIINTNDFLSGLNKISRELDEYYVMGYAPPTRVHDGNYHKIVVKIDRKGVKLRFRTGYYDVKGADILAGKPEGKTLEEQAENSRQGSIPVSLSAPHFYAQRNVARVNLALEIPLRALEFKKDKGSLRTKINILGIAYRADGSVAARFSDSLNSEAQKQDLKESSDATFTYQNSFQIAPGSYNLKVVLGGEGEKFGKYEMPLVIEPYDGTMLHLSEIVLSDHLQPISDMTAGIEEQLLEERTPLVSRGVQVIPSPGRHFKKTGRVGLYVEVYEPMLAKPSPPRVGISYMIYDKKSNQMIHTSKTILLQDFMEKENTIIPVGLLVPVGGIQPGEYRLEVVARNDSGAVSNKQSADFVVE